MSSYVFKRYDVSVAAEGEYATSPTAAAAYQALRPDVDSFSFELSRERLEQDTLRADLAATKSLLGAPNASLKLSVPLRNKGVATAPDSQALPSPELDTLLSACFEAAHRDFGAALLAGGVERIGLVHGYAATQTPGGLVLIDPDGQGRLYPRWLGAPDEEGLFPLSPLAELEAQSALPLATTANGRLYAATHYVPGTSVAHSLSADICGMPVAGKRPRWRINGLVGNAKLSDVASGKRLSLAFEFKGNGYSRAESASALCDSGQLRQAIDGGGELRALGGELCINGAPIAYRQLAVDFGNELAELTDATKATGRAGYRLIKRAPSGSLVTYFDQSLLDGYENGGLVTLSYFNGNAANGLGLYLARCEIRSLKEAEINGLLALEIEFACLQSGTTAPDYVLSLVGRANQ